jgi:hypothetical protein
LLDRRGHTSRHDAAQSSAFDQEGDPATVAPLTRSRALIPPAQDRLDYWVGALILGHLRDGPQRITMT